MSRHSNIGARLAEVEGILAGIEAAFGLPDRALETQEKASAWLATLGQDIVSMRSVEANVNALELVEQIERIIICLPESDATPTERLVHATQQLLTAFKEERAIQ